MLDGVIRQRLLADPPGALTPRPEAMPSTARPAQRLRAALDPPRTSPLREARARRMRAPPRVPRGMTRGAMRCHLGCSPTADPSETAVISAAGRAAPAWRARSTQRRSRRLTPVAQRSSSQPTWPPRQEPLQHAVAVLDRDLREPQRDLRADERGDALLLDDHRVGRAAGRPVLASAHDLRSEEPARSLHHPQPSPGQSRTPPRRLKEDGLPASMWSG